MNKLLKNFIKKNKNYNYINKKNIFTYKINIKNNELPLYIHNLIKLAKFFSISYIISDLIFDITICVGPSMLPTMSKGGDVVLIEHVSPFFGLLKKNDIVVATSPTNENNTVCKRIIGLEDDIVEVNLNELPSNFNENLFIKDKDENENNEEENNDESTSITINVDDLTLDEIFETVIKQNKEYEEKFNKAKIKVPKSSVWLEGDNPNNSTDSRVYGPIRK